MSAVARTLSQALSPFVKRGYETLFTPSAGFLKWDNDRKSWSVENLAPKEAFNYDALIQRLVQDNAYREIPRLEEFLKRLNASRTPSLTKTPHFDNAPTIFFNSKEPNYNFLSNFHPTWFLFKDHNNPEQQRLYSSCENAYQAHKVAYLQAQVSKEAEGAEAAEEAAETPISAEDLNKIADSSPSDSKDLASRMIYVKNSDELAKYKYNLMLEIVTKKFQDNPVLAKWLKKTGDAHLVENTNDSFWGAKNPYDATLSKDYAQSITAASRNVLGRILMEVRKKT